MVSTYLRKQTIQGAHVSLMWPTSLIISTHLGGKHLAHSSRVLYCYSGVTVCGVLMRCHKSNEMINVVVQVRCGVAPLLGSGPAEDQ